MKEMSNITQAELNRYQELKASLEQAQKQLDGLRRGLLARLEAGAHVEPGPLQATCRVVNQRRLTAASLVPLLGKARVEELKNQVLPVAQRHLIVRASPQGAAPPAALARPSASATPQAWYEWMRREYES